MKLIDYTPNSLSHNPINIDYWTTQGIVIDDERYAVEELFVIFFMVLSLEIRKISMNIH